MITNISLVTVYVTDQDAARAFYVDTLGFMVGTDTTLGDGSATGCSGGGGDRERLAKGTMGGFGISTDDCHSIYDELSAKGGGGHRCGRFTALPARGRCAHPRRAG